MSLTTADFGAFHAAAYGGTEPFPWQKRLLDQIVRNGAWPKVLDLPTGAGKTTCIDIAVFALALDASTQPHQRWCPRRIVMVVDRRLVVDQAAERGRKLLNTLLTSSDTVVAEVARRLRSLTRAGEEPLGVFTLRGGIPNDDGWARTPDQPLVIASTVDQVGSRLLMQGYGVSPGMVPVHAGLLANDTLLLLDEVHLSEPFRQTLDQLAQLRTRFHHTGVRASFSHVFLSATPGVAAIDRFVLSANDMRRDAPLGRRLHAKKPTRLIEAENRAELERTCITQAEELLKRHRVIAVVVNRVASAIRIAERLSESPGSGVRVTLLTGRMRPLDRDDVLREVRPGVEAGRARHEDSPQRIIVATQCIEAGVDFDLDAMVTEAASLDSLRQRFGRVDRLGEYGKAEGVIVYDTSAKDDPIYGTAGAATVRWLRKQLKRAPKGVATPPQVDFGIAAMQVALNNKGKRGDFADALAPKPNAPTLLPAYLDLWAQTSPPPGQRPDVSLWLHGPRSTPPDVQVIWRADLTEALLAEGDVEAATGIVAAVRPSSLEAISLPFATVRAWLANRGTLDFGDAEGERSDASDDEVNSEGRRALRWNGDKSWIVDAATLEPGHTIIVPASYGGIRRRCFDPAATEPVSDRAEEAAFLARGRPMLRLHPRVVEHLGLSSPLDEPEEVRAELSRLASGGDWPPWRSLWAELLAKGRRWFAVPGEPRWMVLVGTRAPTTALRHRLGPEAPLEPGVDLTTGGDESFCGDRAVTLAEHSADVETFAREFATRCGLEPWLAEHIAVAAWLHDIGKADRRFQLMLRGGSEIEYFKDETPWAKSATPSGSKAQRRLARERSGYPGGGYLHAVQSVAMLQGRPDILKERLEVAGNGHEPDIDLVLHLIASHHGECRPFAPVILDDRPVEVSLTGHKSERFGQIDFGPTTSDHRLYELDSPLADRFWALIRKYGWHELCWLEAILRLADHRASEEEETRGGGSP